MGSGGRGPVWRDEAASALLVRHLPSLRPRGPVLVMEDPIEEVIHRLAGAGVEVVDWRRRALGGRRATPWPPEGPFGTVALRMPRAKDELAMALHGAAGALAPGGKVLVYGAKDEGINSVARHLEPLFERVETVGVGRHCRVLSATVRSPLRDLRGCLEDWREVGTLEHGEMRKAWVSYPGVFAHGRLDPGTRLLMGALPTLPGDAGILDYGCGAGAVAAMVRHLYPQVRLALLDIDAVALEAARENVPGARFLLGDGLTVPGDGPFDAVFSNPPFHRGKAEEPRMILRLIREAPSVLHKRGGLVLVAQRRISLEEALGGAFKRVGVRAENGAFRVWEGWEPK